MFGSFINQARDKYASEKMSSLHSVDKSCRIRLMKSVSINRVESNSVMQHFPVN